MPNPQNKVLFTPGQKDFLRENYLKMTNVQLASALGLKQTVVRMQLYKMGCFKFRIQHWLPEQVQLLKENYQTKGDTEIAEMLDVKYHKVGGWSKKHVEKKRRYLNLKRTLKQKNEIRERNIQMGRYSKSGIKRWDTIGRTPIGEKRVWYHKNNAPFVVIKTKDGFVPYNRWLWEKEKGEIPPGYNVRIMSQDRINYTIKDLILISDAENSRMNSQNRLPPELKKIKDLSKKLNRIIAKKQ